MGGKFLAAFCLVLSLLLGTSMALLRRLWRIPQEHVAVDEKDKDALRVGMLGASFIGKAACVYAARKRKDVVVAAVASRDASKAVAYAASNGIALHFGGPHAYDELLASKDLDAVYISVPTRHHEHWVRRALAAGKDVLVEKPLTSNAKETGALVDAAAKAGLVLLEAAHHRHHPAMQRAKAAFSEAALGQLRMVEARFHMLDPKALLTTLLARPPVQGPERSHERTKNLDRWWYCADALVWTTGATSFNVTSATESRFRIASLLTLNFADGRSVTASIEMSRDSMWPLFDWSLFARGSQGDLHFSNVGYPFAWHALDFSTSGREQLYGDGQTTWEYQLAAFAKMVRGDRLAAEAQSRASVSTARLVDAVLTAGGEGLISHES